MSSTISAKGQITIPMAIRTLLNWKTGDELDFVVYEPDRVQLVVKKTPVRALKSLVAKPKRALSVEEMNAAIFEGAR